MKAVSREKSAPPVFWRCKIFVAGFLWFEKCLNLLCPSCVEEHHAFLTFDNHYHLALFSQTLVLMAGLSFSFQTHSKRSEVIFSSFNLTQGFHHLFSALILMPLHFLQSDILDRPFVCAKQVYFRPLDQGDDQKSINIFHMCANKISLTTESCDFWPFIWEFFYSDHELS